MELICKDPDKFGEAALKDVPSYEGSLILTAKLNGTYIFETTEWKFKNGIYYAVVVPGSMVIMNLEATVATPESFPMTCLRLPTRKELNFYRNSETV